MYIHFKVTPLLLSEIDFMQAAEFRTSRGDLIREALRDYKKAFIKRQAALKLDGPEVCVHEESLLQCTMTGHLALTANEEVDKAKT